jgi:Flp pilus assembly pilin Flp
MSTSKTLHALARFHRDEQGDEGVNKILIIAMIVVPLVIALIFFGKQIVTFFSNAWKNLTTTSTENSPDKSFDKGSGS